MIHGEALVTVSAWAVNQAEITLLDPRADWSDLVAEDCPLVLHDPLCPMTPPDFLRSCLDTVLADGTVVVGVRPVSDTVKQLVEGQLGATVDRDLLVGVCSPIVFPAAVVADLAGLPDGLPSTDFVTLVGWLRATYDVRLVQAPPSARRVATSEDLRALAALTGPTADPQF